MVRKEHVPGSFPENRLAVKVSHRRNYGFFQKSALQISTLQGAPLALPPYCVHHSRWVFARSSKKKDNPIGRKRGSFQSLKIHIPNMIRGTRFCTGSGQKTHETMPPFCARPSPAGERGAWRWAGGLQLAGHRGRADPTPAGTGSPGG